MDVVVTWLWQGTALGLLAVAGLRAVPRLNAATRYWLLWTALIAVLLLPVFATDVAPVRGASDRNVGPVTATVVAGAPEGTAAPQPLHLPPVPSWLTIVLGALWIGFVGLRVFAIQRSVATVRRIKQDSVPLTARQAQQLSLWNSLHLHGRRAELRMSDAIGVACAAGFLRPMLLIPRSLAETLTPDELDPIVVHEYGHIQRWDDWTNLLQVIIEAVCGWHPAVWYLGRRLRLEREVACDDWVVSRQRCGRVYASCLAKVADLTASRGAMVAPGVTRSARELTSRVIRLLDTRRDISLKPRRWFLAATAAVLVAAVLTFDQMSPLVAFSYPQPADTPRPPGHLEQRALRVGTRIPGPMPPPVVAERRASLPLAARSIAVTDHPDADLVPTAVSARGFGLPDPENRPPRAAPLQTTVPHANLIALPSTQRQHGAIERHRTSDRAPQGSATWGLLADTGRVIGATAADVGVSTADAVTSVSTRFARWLGGSR